MIVWSLFIIDDMGLFFYNKIGSIISIGDLPTTNIIEPFYFTSFKERCKTLTNKQSMTVHFLPNIINIFSARYVT